VFTGTPDSRSRKALSRLHLVLVFSIIAVISGLALLVDLALGGLPNLPVLLRLMALAGLVSSWVEVVIVLGAGPFLRANAFLKKNWKRLVKYEVYWCIYSLLYAALLLLISPHLPQVIHLLTLQSLYTFWPDLAPQLATPAATEASTLVLLMFVLTEALIGIVLGLPALMALMVKITVAGGGIRQAERGQMIDYPLHLRFFSR